MLQYNQMSKKSIEAFFDIIANFSENIIRVLVITKQESDSFLFQNCGII